MANSEGNYLLSVQLRTMQLGKNNTKTKLSKLVTIRIILRLKFCADTNKMFRKIISFLLPNEKLVLPHFGFIATASRNMTMDK